MRTRPVPAASARSARDGAADGASGTLGGRAPAAEPPIARGVRAVELEHLLGRLGRRNGRPRPRRVTVAPWANQARRWMLTRRARPRPPWPRGAARACAQPANTYRTRAPPRVSAWHAMRRLRGRGGVLIERRLSSLVQRCRARPLGRADGARGARALDLGRPRHTRRGCEDREVGDEVAAEQGHQTVVAPLRKLATLRAHQTRHTKAEILVRFWGARLT